MKRCILRLCANVSAAVAAKAAASAPDTPGSAGAVGLSPEKKAFLDSFRQRLRSDHDQSDLESFLDEVPSAAITSAGFHQIKRGVEPLPPWLKLKIPKGNTHMPKVNRIRRSMREKKLATVCEEAKCPNIGECWGGEDADAATATIMLMGSVCTRGCRFCSVATSRTPPPLDPEEPTKTAKAVSEMEVDYIVLTMVDRDDQPDGGSAHVQRCINEIRRASPGLLVEALVGDWRGNLDYVRAVAQSGLHVYAHNIECVERITPRVRDPRANYRQSLSTLEAAAKVDLWDLGAIREDMRLLAPDGTPLRHPTRHLLTKSSIMLGLGETEQEVRQTLRDLRTAGVGAVTLGQYLQPSRTRLKVARYAHPLEFEMWQREALAMGFLYCASGPMVRSSYRAGEFYIKNIIKGNKHGQSPATPSTSQPDGAAAVKETEDSVSSN